MGCRTLIGAVEPDGTYAACYLQWGDHPVRLVPTLRRIWRDAYAADTAAMVDELLSPQRDASGLVCRGQLTEPVDSGLEWLYLLDVDAAAVAVYAAADNDRWRLYSRHRLETTDVDLFTLGGTSAICSCCGAVDDIEFETAPSVSSHGTDGSIRCLRCGSVEITDPMFGAHVTRKPWPPTTPPRQ